MKNIFLFPSILGNGCIADNNAVLCSVSNKGAINIQAQKIKNKIIKHNILFLRGIEFIIFYTYYFFFFLKKSFLNINEKIIYQNKKNVFNKYYFGLILSFVAIVLAVFILGALPTYLGYALANTPSIFLKKLVIATVKCFLVYSIFALLLCFPTIKELYKYNSASNYVLNTEEKDKKMRYHKPLNFFNITISALLISYFVVCLLGLNVGFFWKILINLGITLVAFSIMFEFMLMLETKWHKLKKIILPISILFYSKPSKTNVQVAFTCFNEGKMMAENQERKINEKTEQTGVSLAFVLAEIKEQLQSVGIEEKDEAEWLLASALGCKKYDLKIIPSITKTQHKLIQKAVERRKKGEPIEKIFGLSEFYGLKFVVNENVLTPRQDTEILVENVLKAIGKNKKSVLDIGTGSGAIAISIAKNSNANVLACDISDLALNVAKTNAKNIGVKVKFINSDLFSKIKRKNFDIIVSNPPYIKTMDIKSLQPEVKNFDPILALDGGNDGYYFYEKIAQNSAQFLKNNGKLFLEVGIGQAQKVKKLLTENYKNIKIVKDYNQIERVIIAEKKEGKNVRNNKENKRKI